MADQVSSRRFTLPREHGFWVMMGAAIGCAWWRAPLSSAVVAVALASVFGAIALGSVLGRKIRRSPLAQVSSSALLALLGIPTDRVSGVPWSLSLSTAAAFAALFVSSALMVRVAFARASGGASPWRARWLGALAIGSCVAASLGFAWAAQWAHALVTGIGATVCSLVVGLGPNVKRLKPLGLAMAVLIGIALLVLARGAA